MAAGGTLDIGSLYNLLQEEYGNELHMIQNNESFGYNLIDQASGFRFSGKRVIEAVNASYVASSGYYGQTPASMPTPGTITPALTYIPQCVSLFNLRVDWTAEEKTSSNAFMQAWTASFQTLAEHRKLEKERIFFGNGSCILNPLDRPGGAGNYGIDVVSGTAAGWTFRVHIWDTPKFRIGMQVVFWSNGAKATQANWDAATKRDTPNQGFYTLSNVVPDPANNYTTITVVEASPGINAPADGDYVTIAGAVVEDGHPTSTVNTGNEPMGIDGIISQDDQWLQVNVASETGTVDTFQGISRSTNGYWRAALVTGSGFLNKDQLAALCVSQNVFGTEASSSFLGFMTHYAQEQKYAATIEGAERYTISDSTPTLPGGRTTNLVREGMGPFLTYSGKPIMKSRMARPDRVYALNKKGVKKYILRQAKFESRHQDFGGRPAWQMDGMEMDNIGTVDPASCAVLSGLDVPTAS